MKNSIKEPVRLRRKNLKDGNASLYLDIYLQGKRQYEFLRLYLIPEHSKADKEKNRQTLQLANAVKAKRIVEIQNGSLGFKTRSGKGVRFFDYFVSFFQKRNERNSNTDFNWISALSHLHEYEKDEGITFDCITEEWVKGFWNYLDTEAWTWRTEKRNRTIKRPLAANTKVSYFSKLKVCINTAYKEKIINENPIKNICNFRPGESRRMYLTQEEVRKLAQTPCTRSEVKRAFLFSCLTGLRRSDVRKLTWGKYRNNQASRGCSSARGKPKAKSIST